MSKGVFTTEQLLHANFDRVYKAPKQLIGAWAAIAAVCEPKILVVMDTEHDLGNAQSDAEYVMRRHNCYMIDRVYKTFGARSIYYHTGRIKFQATSMPGRGLGRDWFVLYAEES